MITCEQYEMVDLVVTGDDSRYQLINWMAGFEQYRLVDKQEVLVSYDAQNTIEKQGTQWYVRSNRCLPGLSIYFPATTESDHQNEMTAKKVVAKRYLVCEQFPFGREDTKKNIKNLSDQKANVNTSVTVVLMDLPRRFGSTDDTPPETGLKQAIEEYKTAHISVMVARDSTDLLRVLNCTESLSAIWDRNITEDLKSLKDEIDMIEVYYRYDTLEDFSLEEYAILSHDTRDKICSFRSVQRFQKKNLLENFEQALYEIFFPADKQNGLYQVVKFYRELLPPSLISESMAEQDCADLAEEIRNTLEKRVKYEKHMLNAKLGKSGKFSKPFVPKTKDEFDFAIKQPNTPYYGLDVRFWNVVKAFVESEIPSLMKNRAYKRYKQLEESLL